MNCMLLFISYCSCFLLYIFTLCVYVRASNTTYKYSQRILWWNKIRRHSNLMPFGFAKNIIISANTTNTHIHTWMYYIYTIIPIPTTVISEYNSSNTFSETYWAKKTEMNRYVMRWDNLMCSTHILTLFTYILS